MSITIPESEVDRLKAELQATRAALADAQAAADHLQATLDTSSDAILVIRPDRSILFNVPAARMWDVPQEQVGSSH